ncbi:MAG: hypothetical protein JNL68_16975 [Burkholderiales bacterium]|nr:hypothetical protein [Burkholderiales bacterium]
MHTYRSQQTVDEDRRVTLTLPADFPLGEAEITVFSQEPELEQSRLREAMQALLRRLETLPESGRSKEEIDRYIDEERASWDR